MKTLLTAAAFALSMTTAAFAQSETTGVSNPPAAVIDATPDAALPPPASYLPKPSAAVAYTSSSAPVTYGPYVPYGASGSTASTAPRDPDGEIVTSVPQHREADDDAGIVTYVPSRQNEVPLGTLLRARICETLSTVSTPVGTRFTAEVTAPMERDGRVIVPIGSTIDGRVTVVRGGRRISGNAAIHLLPESVTLPDGTHYIFHAQVIDTSQHNVTRVDSEGTIVRRQHMKGTLAAMSLTTGGAAAAGAVFGGVPGALIGGGIGAGVSTVWWLKQDRQEVIPQNTEIVFSLNLPMIISPMTIGMR
jgi:hypothetical protein